MAQELMSGWGSAIRGVGAQFREFFTQNDLAYTKPWDPVVKTLTSDKAQEITSGKTGAGTLTLFDEGASIPKANRYKLYDTTFAHRQYGKQIEVTYLTLINRDWSAQFDEFKDLTISANVTLSKACAQIFNNSFTNSGVATLNGVRVVTYADGVTLASTVHPRVDGGSSQSNASSTGDTLTETNFETRRINVLEQLQDDGTPITVSGDIYLVVPTALEKTAQIITRSDLRSGTANNDVNIYAGGAYKVMSSVWLGAAGGGSDTRWAVVAPAVARLYLFIRQRANSDQSINANTKSTLFDMISIWSVGSADWHGTSFSRGDGLAYSG